MRHSAPMPSRFFVGAGLGALLAVGSLGSACSSKTPAPAATPVDAGTSKDSSLPNAADAPKDTTADVPDAPDADVEAPDAPPGAEDTSPTPAPGSNFAIHTIQLGDTDRSGNASPTAWQLYGRDVDGKTTTAQSADVCTLVAGASSINQVDGPGGLDNSWGENILPVLLTIFGSTLTQELNVAVNAGLYTMMVDVVGLTSSPTQTGASAPGQYFLGGLFQGTPTWTLEDNWPVSASLLVDGQTVASGSLVTFDAGSIDGGTWSSGTPVDVPLFLPTTNGGLIKLVAHDAVVTFVHDTPSHASAGNLSGVFKTSEFLPAMQTFFGASSASLCQGSVWDSIATQLAQASDILSDGTNVAGQACDGISVGIGFTADQIGPASTTGATLATATDPCDAGAD